MLDRKTLGMQRLPYHDQIKKYRVADIFLCAICYLINWLIAEKKPFERQFVINDPTINHPYTQVQRVGSFDLWLYAQVVPIVVILAFTLLLSSPKRRFYLAYISILGLFVAASTNQLLTDSLKNWIGRLRPDFIARCQPRDDAPKDILVYAKDVCTTKNIERLWDGFRTTPSGHSSESFAGLFYLTMWLSGQLLTEHHDVGSWRKVLALLPTYGATLVALSRTEDYRHHWIDVCIGSLIGTVIAYWAYRRNFPELASPAPFVPYLDTEEDATGEESVPLNESV